MLQIDHELKMAKDKIVALEATLAMWKPSAHPVVGGGGSGGVRAMGRELRGAVYAG